MSKEKKIEALERVLEGRRLVRQLEHQSKSRGEENKDEIRASLGRAQHALGQSIEAALGVDERVSTRTTVADLGKRLNLLRATAAGSEVPVTSSRASMSPAVRPPDVSSSADAGAEEVDFASPAGMEDADVDLNPPADEAPERRARETVIAIPAAAQPQPRRMLRVIRRALPVTGIMGVGAISSAAAFVAPGIALQFGLRGAVVLVPFSGPIAGVVGAVSTVGAIGYAYPDAVRALPGKVRREATRIRGTFQRLVGRKREAERDSDEENPAPRRNTGQQLNR